jgi:hypothetical protein
MASNDEPPKVFGDSERPLSKVSKNYDVGDKGFLTDTEQKMRGMDSDNVGHLTNAKVSAIVTETLALREKTDRMKMWLGILGVAVLVLGLSNLGTAFAAAWLAKDTTINESTGVLLVKDSDTPVAVQSYGQTSNLVLEESTSYGCMDKEDAVKLWTGVLDGTPSSIAIQDPSQQDADVDPSLQAFFALVLTANDATWNETMACMPVSDPSGDKVCVDFTDSRCDGAGRALEGVIDHHTRRKLFHAAAQGHRGLTHIDEQKFVVTIYNDHKFDTGAVNLRTAENFAILAQTGISTVPTSAITGDIGVSPIASAAITGFGLTMNSDGASSEGSQFTGKAFASEYTGNTPSVLTTAVGDMGTAYTDAAGRTNSDAARKNIGAGNLGGVFGGQTDPLTPGVYTFGTNVNIGADIFFDGQDNSASVFIIQITGSLLQASNTKVLLVNGAKAENIFWQVAGVAVVSAGAHMEGILLVKTAVTFVTSSSLHGRVLTQTACNLQMATITQPDVKAVLSN